MSNLTRDNIRQRVLNARRFLPKKENIKRIALFGSYLHGDQGQESDIDLLIEFTGVVTLLDMGGMKNGLEKHLGREIDLVTPQSLSKYFREDVLNEAQTIYER